MVMHVNAEAPAMLVEPEEVSYAKAVDLFTQGRAAAAAAVLDRLLQRNPHDMNCLYLGGIAHALVGALPEAEDRLRRLVAQNPRNTQPYYNLAIVLVRSGKSEEALDVLQDAIRSLPSDLLLMEKAAELSYAVGAFELAVILRQKLIASTPNAPHHMVALCNALVRRGRIGEAAATIGDAMDEIAKQPHLLTQAVRTLWLSGNLDATEQALRTAIAQHPKRATAHYSLGTVLLHRRKPAEAIAAFDDALALDPALVDAWYNRGIACQLGRDVAGALASYEKVLEEVPDHALASVQHASLRMAHFAYAMIERINDDKPVADLIERLKAWLQCDPVLVDEAVHYFMMAGLIDLLLQLLTDMAKDGAFPAERTWGAMGNTLMAQYNSIAQLDYEVERYGHVDFRTQPGFASPLLAFLKEDPAAVLAEAATMYNATQSIQSAPNVETCWAACKTALRQGDVAGVVRLIDDYRVRAGETPLLLSNLLAFTRHVQGQTRAAEIILSRNNDGHRRVPAVYADAAAVAKSRILPPVLGGQGRPETIEMRLCLTRAGQTTEVNDRITLPPCSLHEFQDVRLLNDHGTLLTRDDQLVRQTINCDPGRYIYGWPSVDYSIGDKALVSFPETVSRIRTPVVIAAYSRDQTNYAHWMLDVLPRILLATEEPELRDHLIVVTQDLTKWQQEVLNLLGVDMNRVVSVGGSMPVQFDRAVLPVTSDGLYFLPDALRLLRRRFAATGLMSGKPPRRKVYITRKSNFRRLLNDKAVAECLATRGFETVSPGELTVAEQVRLFSETETLVAAGGAAVTNMLFMQSGSRSLVFGPSSNYGNYFAYLGRLIDVGYSGVVGTSHPDLHNAYVGWDYSIDTKDLETALARL